MYSKVLIVVSADAYVIPRYSKPLMHVHKVQITSLDDLQVGEKALERLCVITQVMVYYSIRSFILLFGNSQTFVYDRMFR